MPKTRSRSLLLKDFPARLAEIRDVLPPGTGIELWFADEARSGQRATITHRWAKRGTRPSAPHDQPRQSADIFGALCPKKGKDPGRVMPRCDRHAMRTHLAEEAARKAEGRWRARDHRRRHPRPRFRGRPAEPELAGRLQQYLGRRSNIWTAKGGRDVAVVLDLFSRRVVGWPMKADRDASLVMEALTMAGWPRGKADALLHSTLGCLSPVAFEARTMQL